jgi:hypothetical protein
MFDHQMHYRLDGHVPVPCTFEEWVASGSSPTIVAQTTVTSFDGKEVFISTIFTGTNTSVFGEPQVFETMYFMKGEDCDVLARYATWALAEEWHWRFVVRTRRALFKVVQGGMNDEEGSGDPVSETLGGDTAL